MSNTWHGQQCCELSGKCPGIVREFHIVWRVVTLNFFAIVPLCAIAFFSTDQKQWLWDHAIKFASQQPLYIGHRARFAYLTLSSKSARRVLICDSFFQQRLVTSVSCDYCAKCPCKHVTLSVHL